MERSSLHALQTPWSGDLDNLTRWSWSVHKLGLQLRVHAGTPLPRYPGYSVEVKYATEHRCGVVLHGPGLSDAVSGTDPLKDNLPLVVCKPLDDSPEVRPSGKSQ